MAATGKTPILLYGSTTASNAPVAGNLTNSSDGCEIAINVADKNLFFKDSTNAVNTVPIRQSSASSNGWLSSTDWSTFNGKAPAFTYTSGYIPFGQGTTTPAEDSSLYWDNTNKKLSIGTTTPTSSALAGKVPDINVQKSGTSYSSLAARSFATTNAAGGMLVLGRSNSATLGTLTATTDGQNFGYIGFEGVNTSSAVSYPAYITAQEDGANGATYTPGRIMFYTGTAAAAPVEQLRIASTGDVTVKTGNLVIGTSGKGIDFSATAGTGTSELLADYEEGTFTPTVAGSTTAGTHTYTTQVGRYTKVGDMVYVQIAIVVNAMGTGGNAGAGYTTLAGLPYTPGSTNNQSSLSVGWLALVTFTNTPSAYCVGGATFVTLRELTSAGYGATIPIGSVANGAYISVSGCYKI